MKHDNYRSERHYALERNYPSCSGGSCAQGVGKCATPQACLVSEPSWRDLASAFFRSEISNTIAIGLLGVLGLVILVVYS